MTKKRILYISSRPPYHSAGLAEDGMKVFMRMGYDVDFLTLYPFIGQKKNQYSVLPRPLSLIFRQLRERYPWLASLRKLYHTFVYRFLSSSEGVPDLVVKDNILIPCENEQVPPVEIEKILKKIRVHYDYIVTLVWQDMITAATLQALYDKTKAPIICCVVDQYPYTGNCYYPSYCKEYRNECVKCPVFENKRNPLQAHQNYLFKKQVYSSIPCRFTANSYVKKFILETGIVAEEQIVLKSFMLDTDVFKPLSISKCRKELNIHDEKEFIILMRYIDPTSIGGSRKGIPNAFEAMHQFSLTLDQSQRDKVLLLLIGDDQIANHLLSKIDFDILSLGRVNQEYLIKAYNAASVFLSPTLDDAGPSMVNQAMACGTPVVSFEIGTALDVVQTGKTGFIAKLADNEIFSSGISSIYKLSESEYQQMRVNARNMALEMNSIQSAEKVYEKVFNDLEASRDV